nr:MAG TPA: hypothetical protein [Caudoviricetes sp.]
MGEFNRSPLFIKSRVKRVQLTQICIIIHAGRN